MMESEYTRLTSRGGKTGEDRCPSPTCLLKAGCDDGGERLPFSFLFSAGWCLCSCSWQVWAWEEETISLAIVGWPRLVHGCEICFRVECDLLAAWERERSWKMVGGRSKMIVMTGGGA